MIYVTHDQTEALTFADTVVVMHDGRVVQSGTPAELFDKPAHTFVGYFIGSPGMNIVPAKVSGREAGSTVTSSRSTAAMTACRTAPRSSSACVPNSSTWRCRRRACWRQHRADRRPRAASVRAVKNRRCQIRGQGAAWILFPGNVAGLIFDHRAFTSTPTAV